MKGSGGLSSDSLLSLQWHTPLNRGVYVGPRVVQSAFQGNTRMESIPGAKLVAEETITVGQSTVVQGPSPSTSYGVVFEDDGETGYFYGIDFSRRDNPIVDALAIYNVEQVADRAKVVQLVWAQDGLKAALLINGYPHAVFDFEGKRGYCRTGFPPATGKWTQHDHSWDDRAMELFK
jgi:hypothetical protein